MKMTWVTRYRLLELFAEWVPYRIRGIWDELMVENKEEEDERKKISSSEKRQEIGMENDQKHKSEA